MLPDFLIIGAMKCGTTTVQAQLAAQPGIFMSEPKEPNFFSDDPVHARGPNWYESLFADAKPGDLKGEASTHYTKLPTYPETLVRMQAVLPAPRLIYVIRNPLDRLVSHYVHGWSQREITVGFDTALGRHPELVDYGRFGMQITPFLEHYGSEAVLLTALELIRADPDRELARIGAHIGHPEPLSWVEEAGAENVSAQRSRRLPAHGVLVDHPVARALRHALVPKPARNWVRARRQFRDRPSLSAAQRARLEEVFLEDRSTLAGFFPGQPALDACYPFAVPS